MTPRISLVEPQTSVGLLDGRTRVVQVGYREGGIPGLVQVGYREGGIPGYYPAADWYCQGPTNALPGPYRVPSGTPGPSWALRTPDAPAPVGCQIWRDSIINILKLDINPECHLKSVMRPVILPVSKSHP